MTMKESYSSHGNGNHYGNEERPRYQERDKSRHRGSQHGSQHDLHSQGGRYNPGYGGHQDARPGAGHEARAGERGEQGDNKELEVFENKIYVGGVPMWMEEKELGEYFAKYGEVENVTVIDRSNEQGPNRYAFITFAPNSLDTVKKLLNEIDPNELTVTGGRTLTVGPARQRHYWNNNYQGGPRGGWHHGDGGRYHHHRYDHGGRRHYQGTWTRRADKPHQETGARRPREDKVAAPAAASDKEDVKDAAAGGRAEPVPQQVLPEPNLQNHIAFGSDLIPTMMFPQQPQGGAPFPYPGYEAIPGAAGAMMYPGAGPFLAPAMPPGNGYMEQQYYDQQMMAMTMPQAGFYGPNYGAGGMFYPVLYPPHQGQPQYYNQQPPLYPQYPPQTMEAMLSDSGYHDMTAASSSVLYQDTSVHHPHMAMEAGQGQEASVHEVEASPILNMSNLITQEVVTQEPGGQENGQQVAPGNNMFAPGQPRCFNTPNKSFAQFRGGNHLDPLGNKYPFRGHKGRKFSSSSQHEDVNGGFMNSEVARDSIIQPPLNNNNDRHDAFKHDPNIVNKRIENQPDILQDSLKQLTIQ